jgi:hypothetical protein
VSDDEVLEAVGRGVDTVRDLALVLGEDHRAGTERVRRRVRRLVAEQRLAVEAHPRPPARWGGGVVPARYTLPGH